jgi:glycosyltransferase involved in cell wall biosynthesis
MKKKIKLVLAVRALDIGGAERQFLEIVKKINRDEFDVLVVTTHNGALDKEIAEYPNFCAAKTGRWDVRSMLKLRKVIIRFKPDAIYSFMPDMNITMALIKLVTSTPFKLIWGQFGSEPDFSAYGKIRKRIYQIQQKLEFVSDCLISDGSRGIEFLEKFNHKLDSSIVIVSGTDIDRFKRNSEKRKEFRNKHGLADDDIAIGICSRLDPMKGYLVLAKAARQILKKYPNTKFFSIGYGQDSLVDDAKKILGDESDKFIWFGKQIVPEDILAGWDIYCSPSLYGEGFSNSIIEAMSCSLPVIATDVGDAPYQVDGVGVILKPGDAEGLFNTLDNWISSKYYIEGGEKSRKRVFNNFSSKLMTKRTEDYIKEIIEN